MRQRDLEKTLTKQMDDANTNIARGLELVAKEQAKLDSFRAVFAALQNLLDGVKNQKKPKAAGPKKAKNDGGIPVDGAAANPGRPL